MSEIAEFILARIAEEEHAAREAMRRGREASAMLSPARLLAFCASRRQLVALHEMHVDAQDASVLLDGESGSCRAGQSERTYLCPTLRLLALPYIDHVDYNAAWSSPREVASLTATR